MADLIVVGGLSPATGSKRPSVVAGRDAAKNQESRYWAKIVVEDAMVNSEEETYVCER